MKRKKPENGRLTALGLMSGTSMDGIDAALLVTDGEESVERGPSAAFPYDVLFRKRIESGLTLAADIEDRRDRPAELAALEREITLRHAEAVHQFLARMNVTKKEIDVVGFHGQTVLHRPEKQLTVQLGDGPLLARETGIRVVCDLRAEDMTKGGQGAPLVPVYHRALVANLTGGLAGIRPVTFVNIGGIANISWIGRDGSMLAFDTGPGNALIDQWVTAKAGIPFDQGGAIASEGSVVDAIAAGYLDRPFFARPGPKSLDRNDFRPLDPTLASLEDGARTLAHVTAAAIVKACDHLPEAPMLWIVSGGGSRNLAILRDLTELVARQRIVGKIPPLVVTAADAGFDADAMEAEAWAYLAVRSIRGLNITFPGTTGVREPSSGGVLVNPETEEA